MLASLEARYPGLAFAWPRPGVLEITFRGEKLNAMPPALHRALARVWRDLEAVEGVRAVLLRGEGGVFSIFVSDLCKGCGECVQVCGDHDALRMTRETEELNAELITV